MKKISYLFLIFILILAIFLRFYGIDWGIPKEPYWRNHYQDEAFVLGLIFKMAPPDLNPHYFINPTLHYYTLLVSLKIAALVNYLKTFSLPISTNRLGQPTEKVVLNDFSKMFYVGRLLSIVEGILVVLFIFLIATKLYNEKVGIIAALFTTILPTHIYQSHFLVADAPGLFWLILAFLILTTKIYIKNLKLWHIFSGLFIGLAVGAKYTNLLIFLPFFYKVYQLNKDKKTTFFKKIFNKYSSLTVLISVLAFFFTTPYALLSFNEFLNGDKNGFGGIFGQRGLFYYNAYPFNLISPFTVATFHSLQLPLTILALLGLAYLIYKRDTSDLFLLFFIIPFYLMLIYRASPHLRHILPVLPFLMIAQARMIDDLIANKKIRFLKPIVFIAVTFTFIYTLFFSIAMVKRMTPIDSRIESANWVKDNISKESTIGLASFFPWNYTPPIDMITEKIILTGYNYEELMKSKPDYFIITEYEQKEFSNAREPEFVCQRFIERLFNRNEYKIIKEFKKDFEFLGFRFYPDFPNMDWNPVNPKVFIFKRSE